MATNLRNSIVFFTYKTIPSSSPLHVAPTPLRARNVVKSRRPFERHSSTARRISEKEVADQRSNLPLSALSNSALLRSLFINAVSSKPWLLTPSIHLMSLLCRPGKSFLFDVDRNKVLARVMKETIYKQFCAGETTEEVKSTMKYMKDKGFRGTILTYAQETVFDHGTKTSIGMGIQENTEEHSELCQNIESWRKGTLKTVEMLGEGDQLAIKMTGAGPLVTEAFAAGELPPQQMLDALHEICSRCKSQKVRILIDAESQHYQSGIFLVGMNLSRKYNRDGYAVIYNGYQAYLKSTANTLTEHLIAAREGNFTLGIKLVRGAYLASDPRQLIHDTKRETDDAYNGIAKGILIKQFNHIGTKDGSQFPSVNLVLAGHNRESVLTAYELYQQRLKDGLPVAPLGFAQLQGMSDEISFKLIQLNQGGGPGVYKCSTWGTVGECLGYLARRATENREAASRTGEAYAALKSEAGNRLVSMFSFPYK